MPKKVSGTEWARRTARSLTLVAEGLDKQGGSDPESIHRYADRLRELAASLIERAKAGK